jgi:predicted phosphodiesterase
MSRSLRLAILGDIHGNLPALEVVLTDIDRQAPDAVFLLGDLINRCPWTREVLDILRERDWLSVQGNHDLVLALLHTSEGWPLFNERQRFPIVHWTWEQLRPTDISYLLNLPHDLLIEIDGAPRLRLFHGLPGDPFAGIVAGTEEEEVANKIAIYDEPVIICGHTHQPLDRMIPGKMAVSDNGPVPSFRQRVLNPGSVGMPYNGDPRAHYLLLDLVDENRRPTWQPDFRRLTYDRKRVVRAFRSSGQMEANEAVSKLILRTLEDGLPWVSDFPQWLRNQPPAFRSNPESAVDLYLRTHGPGQWAFTG